MDMHTILLFALASLTLNLIPGPDVIYIVSNTMKGKASAGTQAALGLGVGYMFHTFAAVFGLSALILSSAYAFMLVKYLGAAYLLYLGISSLRNFMKGESKLTLPDQKPETTNVFRQGVIVSVLNPKVAMFFPFIFYLSLLIHRYLHLQPSSYWFLACYSVVWRPCVTQLMRCWAHGLSIVPRHHVSAVLSRVYLVFC